MSVKIQGNYGEGREERGGGCVKSQVEPHGQLYHRDHFWKYHFLPVYYEKEKILFVMSYYPGPA